MLDANNMSRTCAEVICTVLERHGNEAVDWKGMTPAQKEAAKELMVLALVAEGAMPSETEVA